MPSNLLPPTGSTLPPATGDGPISFSPAPLQPGHDPIEKLPEGEPQNKLRRLRLRSADSHRLIPEFEQVRQSSMAKISAERELQRLIGPAMEGGFNLGALSPQVIMAKRLVDKLTGEFDRLTEMQRERSSAWQAASVALQAVEGCLRDVRGELEAVEIEAPRLLKGEDIIAGIERLRRRGREIAASAHAVRSAPYPSTHAIAKMRAKIEALAELGTPDVSLLVEHDGDLIFPTSRMQSEVIGVERALAFAQTTDSIAVLCWLHRDAMIAALDKEIMAEADDGAALGHEARRDRLAELAGDRLAIEREESMLVWQAQASGVGIEHRQGCDPMAILGVKIKPAKPAGRLPGTTAGHSWDILQPWR